VPDAQDSKFVRVRPAAPADAGVPQRADEVTLVGRLSRGLGGAPRARAGTTMSGGPAPSSHQTPRLYPERNSRSVPPRWCLDQS
jgi:hypothetical protein